LALYERVHTQQHTQSDSDMHSHIQATR